MAQPFDASVLQPDGDPFPVAQDVKTIDGAAKIDQAGSGTVADSGGAAVLVAAADITDIDLSLTASSGVYLPIASGISLLIDAVKLSTTTNRTTEVELGELSESSSVGG